MIIMDDNNFEMLYINALHLESLNIGTYSSDMSISLLCFFSSSSLVFNNDLLFPREGLQYE